LRPAEQLAVPAARWPIADVVALTKPRITFMVLLTTAGGLWLGQRHAPVSGAIWALTLLGTALVVGGANALNMVLERDTDALMRRTANRPLPAGRLPVRTALWVGVALSVASVPILAIGVNPTTALLAVLANLLYVLGYTPLKRRTHWALQVGAIPGAIPPLLGWTAATGRIELGGMALFAILFAWQIAHFHAIALFRKADYARAGLVVMPNAEGDHATRHAIVRWAGVLFCFSLSLSPLGVTHALYAVVAVVIGVGFLGICLLGLRSSATMKSARAAFFASLVYNVTLFAALVVDGLTG
jgi:protoheme IX farnesyltransferase